MLDHKALSVEIEHLYSHGDTMHDIASKLGIAVGSVYNIMKEFGLYRRAPHTWFTGHTHSEEARRSFSKTHKGKVVSEETKQKMRGPRKHGLGHRKKRHDGYIGVYLPDESNSKHRTYIMEHVYVMEQAIGRKLKDDEVVHHINHVRDDNRLENLKLMTRKEHCSFHMKERHAAKRGVINA